MYLVQSQSQPDLQYEVDLELYTCNCPSFPSIRFCKHICATQNIFCQETTSLAFLESPPTTISSQEASPELASPELPPCLPEFPLPPTNHSLSNKLDILSAQLWSNPSWIPSDPENPTAADDFDNLLARFIELSANDAVLPRKKKVPPNSNTARETAASMSRGSMPKVKTARNPLWIVVSTVVERIVEPRQQRRQQGTYVVILLTFY